MTESERSSTQSFQILNSPPGTRVGISKRIAFLLCMFASILSYTEGGVDLAIAAGGTDNNSNNRTHISSEHLLHLRYGFPSWNKDNKNVNSASLLMRDQSTKRIVQIQLEETGPDTSTFEGTFSVRWDKTREFAPDFFIPQQELLADPKGLKAIKEMIDNNKIKRVPFILRRKPNGEQSVELFDSKKQAQKALEVYKAELLAAEQQKKKVNIPNANSSDSLNQAQVLAEAKARAAAAAAAAAEAERVRLEQIEARKKLEREAENKKRAAAELEARRKQANTLSQQAMQHFAKSEFQLSAEKFEQAIELDPENKQYYFQYAVALYRIDNFNKSLVYLNLADGAKVNTAEKNFYKGLCFHKLKDYKNAVDSFTLVKNAKNLDLSPSAAFYIGMILFDQKKYIEAKDAFQVVLDTSKDPKLDERAENYIEIILRVMQFEAERSKNILLSANLGMNFDSNVVQTADSARDTGIMSDSAGWRSLQMLGVKYRPVFSEHHEFSTGVDLLNMYTLDSKFKTNQSFRNADPTVMTFSAPYSYKGQLFGKGYKFDLTPGYEVTRMSAEDNTAKNILSSLYVNILNTHMTSESWVSTYNLEVRQETSNLKSSTGDNDSSATKGKFTFGSIYMIDKKKTEMLTSDIGYTLNNAKGNNMIFNRIDMSVGYIKPIFWKLTFNPKLSYFILKYPKNLNSRADNSYTFNLTLGKKFNDILSAGLSVGYNKNNSNVETFKYSRITGTLIFSAAYGF